MSNIYTVAGARNDTVAARRDARGIKLCPQIWGGYFITDGAFDQAKADSNIGEVTDLYHSHAEYEGPIMIDHEGSSIVPILSNRDRLLTDPGWEEYADAVIDEMVETGEFYGKVFPKAEIGFFAHLPWNEYQMNKPEYPVNSGYIAKRLNDRLNGRLCLLPRFYLGNEPEYTPWAEMLAEAAKGIATSLGISWYPIWRDRYGTRASGVQGFSQVPRDVQDDLFTMLLALDPTGLLQWNALEYYFGAALRVGEDGEYVNQGRDWDTRRDAIFAEDITDPISVTLATLDWYSQYGPNPVPHMENLRTALMLARSALVMAEAAAEGLRRS